MNKKSKTETTEMIENLSRALGVEVLGDPPKVAATGEVDWIPEAPNDRVTRCRLPMGFGAGDTVLTQARVEDLALSFASKGWNPYAICLHPDEMKAHMHYTGHADRFVLGGVHEMSGARLEKYFNVCGEVTLIEDVETPRGRAIVEVVAGLPKLRQLGAIERRELARVAWNAGVQYQRVRGEQMAAWGELMATRQETLAMYVDRIVKELTDIRGEYRALGPKSLLDPADTKGWRPAAVFVGILRALILAEASESSEVVS